MATLPNPAELWTVQDYLRTVWRPDCEFVDGRIEERNLGEKDHSILQRYFTILFGINRKAWGVEVFPELRTQTRSTRFRVPDVLVVRSSLDFERYLTTPPMIAIEILSPEDTLSKITAKSMEYLEFGAEHVWVFDPMNRRAMVADRFGLHLVESEELTVAGTPIRIELKEVFAELDA